MNEEMMRFEKETGKKALWKGLITEKFKKWQRGEKIYNQDKERIGILVSEETKTRWQDFANNNNKITTISRLIRMAVDFYIDYILKTPSERDFAQLSYDLKASLTTIKGFSQLIIEKFSNKLDPDILLRIKEIYNQSLLLENNVKGIQNDKEAENNVYDILIIEDDAPTIMVLTDFFELKGYTCKGVLSGIKGLEELNRNTPKLIILDVILNDISGYEICNKIKSDENLKEIPVFYITAIPESEIVEKLEETGANGFFLKPFNFSQFEILFDYL
ncbi:MAG: response regulator [Candidatus Lokiarchaeota archaeon]|nr:response regulator [Candidatus Lokiarchaeota archaeon]